MNKDAGIAHWKRLGLSFAVTAVLWLIFSWPLASNITSGIPSSSQNIEKDAVRRMIVGDHLQLHYNYWLFSDMLSGNTPFFENIYEFNRGRGEDRYSPGNYNMPFSLVYAAVRIVGSRALAWNITGLVSLWLTHLFTWFLLRRYGLRDLLAGCVALIGIAVPYRWVALLGGSPTGYAMMWIPAIILGLDMLVRESSLKGSLLFAASLVVLYWNDRQIYYYVTLAIPFWGIVALTGRESFELKKLVWWRKLVLAAIPAALSFGYCIIDAVLVKSAKLDQVTVGAFRGRDEAGLYSHQLDHLFVWQGFGKAGHAYIGYVMVGLLALGLLLAILLYLREPGKRGRQVLRLAMLFAGVTMAVLLAVGVNGPGDGAIFKAARKVLPMYAKVRQTGKVYCLLPTFLAVASACSLSVLIPFAASWRKSFIPAFIALIIVGDYAFQSRATICLIDDEQPGYAAIAADAQEEGKDPHALIVPLWRGDSDWGALYEHYVSLYRIRMINGYRPTVSPEYYEDAYISFRTANGGILSDAQLDDLLSRGIDYVLLHEDAFPEQVCPFPVAFAIKRFLNNPRMSLLKQGENVWAFKIHAEAEDRPEMKTGWTPFFPTRYQELERTTHNGETVKDVEDACDGSYLVLDGEGQLATLKEFRHWNAPDAAFMIRVRGQGVFEVDPFPGEEGMSNKIPVDTDEWTWVAVPIESFVAEHMTPEFEWVSGTVQLDVMTYISGRWPFLAPGQEMAIPAALFFHAGHMDFDSDSVVMKAGRQPDGAIFYGPKLPLAPGNYEVAMKFTTDSPDGTVLGSIRAKTRLAEMEEVTVIAGQPAVGTFSPGGNVPVRFDFVFSRNGDLVIEQVVFRRLAD